MKHVTSTLEHNYHLAVGSVVLSLTSTSSSANVPVSLRLLSEFDILALLPAILKNPSVLVLRCYLETPKKDW